MKAIADIVCSKMILTGVEYNFTCGDRGWKGDMPKFSYDISNIQNMGWRPMYTSDEADRQSVKEARK